MNILCIHPHDIFSPQEPWTIRIVNLSREFVKSGHNVKLLYFPLTNYENAKSTYIEGGFEATPLRRKLGPSSIWKNFLVMKGLSGWADIVHFQKCFHWASLPAILAAYIKGKPIHYEWDDWEEKIFILSNKRPSRIIVAFLKALERFLPKLADTVSVSSQRLKGLCVEFGVKHDRIFWTPVGADLEMFSPLRPRTQDIRRAYGIDSFLVLYLGQLHGSQYVELFLDAARIISETDEGNGVRFMVMGDGYGLASLKARAKELKLQNLLFTGFVPHTRVWEYLAEADVCVACFERNDVTMCKSPLKIAEYLASGRAIVASDVGEVRRMISDAGVFVGAGDSESLAEAILKLLKDEKLRYELGRRARGRAEEIFNWRSTAATLLKAYKLAQNTKNKIHKEESRMEPITGEDSVERCLELLQDGSPGVRKKAIAKLGQLKHKRATAALLEVLTAEDEVSLKAEAAMALGEIGDPEGIPALREMLSTSTDPQVRTNCALALGKLKDIESIPCLLEMLSKEKQPQLRASLVLALRHMGRSEVVAPILNLLTKDKHPEVRAKSALALGEIGDESVRDALLMVSKQDRDRQVRVAASMALARLKWSQKSKQ